MLEKILGNAIPQIVALGCLGTAANLIYQCANTKGGCVIAAMNFAMAITIETAAYFDRRKQEIKMPKYGKGDNAWLNL